MLRAVVLTIPACDRQTDRQTDGNAIASTVLACNASIAAIAARCKKRDAQQKRSIHKARGVSPEAGSEESMMGKICERRRF